MDCPRIRFINYWKQNGCAKSDNLENYSRTRPQIWRPKTRKVYNCNTNIPHTVYHIPHTTYHIPYTVYYNQKCLRKNLSL